MHNTQLNTQLPKQQRPARGWHQNSEVLWVGKEDDSHMLRTLHRNSKHPPEEGEFDSNII